MDQGSAHRASLAAVTPSRKSIPPFEALRAFDAVARMRSIRQAAKSLGRDHSIVSRHLRTIEDWTGVQLVERTAGGVTLTEHGRRYHKHIATAIETISHATIDLMRSGENRLLHLSCAPGFALHWMSARADAFERAYPDVEIELRPVDRTLGHSLNEADVDIRFIPTSYGPAFQLAPGLKSVEVARAPILAFATPAYIARSPQINEPKDLLNHRLLHEHSFDIWANWLASHGVYDEVDLNGPRLWHSHLTLDAALRGRGITLMNRLVATDLLASGHIVEIGRGLASFQPHAEGAYLFIAREDRWNAAPVRAYRRWLTDTMARELGGSVKS